jgi:hypothetical protein
MQTWILNYGGGLPLYDPQDGHLPLPFIGVDSIVAYLLQSSLGAQGTISTARVFTTTTQATTQPTLTAVSSPQTLPQALRVFHQALKLLLRESQAPAPGTPYATETGQSFTFGARISALARSGTQHGTLSSPNLQSAKHAATTSTTQPL